MYDAIKEHTGFDISEMDEAGIRNVYVNLKIHAMKMGKGN
jgi:lysyl-tRNA synthetase class 2